MHPQEVAKVGVSIAAVVGVAFVLLTSRTDSKLLAFAAAILAVAAFTAFTSWADADRKDKRWRVQGGIALAVLVVLALGFTGMVLSRHKRGSKPTVMEFEMQELGGMVDVDLDSPPVAGSRKSRRSTRAKMSPKERRAYEALFEEMGE